MYNILVFGFEEGLGPLANHYGESCKFIHIHSVSELYSTAFARVYDAWIIENRQTTEQEQALLELIASRKVPHIFIFGKDLDKHTLCSHTKVTGFNPGEYKRSAEFFVQLMRNQREQNREKYLAGYLNLQPGLPAIVTNSPLMEQLLLLVKDTAPTDSPVFLIGETGTGKELLANIFHNESRRKAGPFMAVNCGALPDTLLESELFGYEKGAFTGAGTQRKGKIEEAAGGTLFLDEVEAMSSAMQIRLLRVLQEKSLQRLGGNAEIGTDFRVIAATNTDPTELLNSGRLRSDLYYRLAVFQIHIPPLRDRTEDIPLLVQHFLNKKKRDGRDYVTRLDNQSMKMLMSVPWFGNVRELQNVIERAVMLASSSTITADLIQIPTLPLGDSAMDVSNLTENAFRPGTTLKSYKNLLSQSAERKYLVELLEYTGGRIGEAAQLAGLTPRALYNKMKIHGLKKEQFKKSEA